MKKLSFIISIFLILTLSIPAYSAPYVIKPTGEKYDIINNFIKHMTIEEKIGQMLMPSIRYTDGSNVGEIPGGTPVTEMVPELRRMIQNYYLGGVILFAQNVQTTEQTVKLTNEIQKASPKIPLFISIDQEGGLVYRLQEGTQLPGNMAIGATRSTDLAYKNGKVIGAELKAVGINWNLAPVADVNINPANPVIGVRSFGGDPDLVSKMTIAYMKGVQSEGVAACLKHFPGHGDTAIDSHLGLGIVDKDRATLDKVELKPFRDAIEAGADAIMTAHLSFPALDDTKVTMRAADSTEREITMPATLSYKILTELVRNEWGFEGVIITDAMNMKAISDNFGPVDAAIRAVKAGADIVLMPVDVDGVFKGLVKEVKEGRIPESRIDESVRRILTLKLKRGIMKFPAENVEEIVNNAKSIVGCEEHLSIERETAQKAITLIRNNNSVLPIKDPDSSKKILVIAGTVFRTTTYISQIEKYHPQNNESIVVNDSILNSSTDLTGEVKAAIDRADIIIVATNNITKADNQIVKMMNYGKGKTFIFIAVRNPYDIMYYPNADVYLAQYGWNASNLKAAIDVIFGNVNPSGKLPAEIPGFYPIGHGLSY